VSGSAGFKLSRHPPWFCGWKKEWSKTVLSHAVGLTLLHCSIFEGCVDFFCRLQDSNETFVQIAHFALVFYTPPHYLPFSNIFIPWPRPLISLHAPSVFGIENSDDHHQVISVSWRCSHLIVNLHQFHLLRPRLYHHQTAGMLLSFNLVNVYARNL